MNRGEFRLPICTWCKTKVWPPSYHCPRCLSSTSLQIVDTNGILLYFSKSYLKDLEGCFGLIDMDGVRLIGSFETVELKEGLRVKMVKCGLKPGGTPYYFFEPIKSGY
ncbi:MAG: zinc ribbon domain-containing protein [Thermoproteota archaeon]|nr:zinc ribbon domain-containing protein [Thermoproteota archaeon]